MDVGGSVPPKRRTNKDLPILNIFSGYFFLLIFGNSETLRPKMEQWRLWQEQKAKLRGDRSRCRSPQLQQDREFQQRQWQLHQMAKEAKKQQDSYNSSSNNNNDDFLAYLQNAKAQVNNN